MQLYIKKRVLNNQSKYDFKLKSNLMDEKEKSKDNRKNSKFKL